MQLFREPFRTPQQCVGAMPSTLTNLAGLATIDASGHRHWVNTNPVSPHQMPWSWISKASVQKAQNKLSTQLIEVTSCAKRSNVMINSFTTMGSGGNKGNCNRYFVALCGAFQACVCNGSDAASKRKLFKLMAPIALCVGLNLFDLMTAISAIIHSSVLNRLEILGESRKGRIAKFPAGAHVFHSVGLVECLVEPFHLKVCAGRDNVARG